MPKILTECCSGLDCKAMIHGDEEIFFRDVPEGWDAQPYEAVLASYGKGLEEDLRTKAIAAGWQWDGTQWLCKTCWRKSRLGDTNDRINVLVELEVELIAHSMNV